MTWLRPNLLLGTAVSLLLIGLASPNPLGAQSPSSGTPGPDPFTPGLGSLHGFADVGAGVASGAGASGFTNGSVDFYLTPQLSVRVKSLIELVFEYDAEGALLVDLERIQVGYALSDVGTLWLGRFHTPIGFWNTAYHHGTQIQTSVTRPRFIDFEDAGGTLPVHTVGSLFTGNRRVGPGRVFYDLFVGNAQRILDGTLDPQNVAGPHNAFGGGFNVAYRHGTTDAWPRVGVHMYGTASGREEDPSSTPARFIGAYVARENETWEVLGEYYRFSDPARGPEPGPHSWAAFLQVATPIGDYAPYVRFERLAVNGSERFLTFQTSGTSYRRAVAGLRFELTPTAALKVEVSRDRSDDTRSETGARLQWAIRF